MAHPSTPTPPDPQRSGAVLTHMPAIDGLRGVAILMVLCHHFTPAVSGSVFTKRLLETAHVGWVGVDLFFVLSGFLITSILLRTRSAPDYFLNFYARRTLRIFPIYYLTLFALLVVLPFAIDVPLLHTFVMHWFGKVAKDLPAMMNGQSWLWLYGTNVKVALEGERWGAVNHFWSLAVEEHFYLVWPVVVFLVPREKLKRVCLTLILGAPVLRLMMMLAGMDSVVPYVLTFSRVDSLAMGALMAVLISERNGLETWRPRIAAGAMISTAGVIALLLCYRRFDRDDLITTFVGYTFLALISAWLVLAASQVRAGTGAAKVVANPVFTSLGRYSYGIYVTHMFFAPTFILLFPWTGLHKITGAYWSAIVLHAALSIACAWGIAWCCYHGFEKHFLRLKGFFDYRKPVGTPAIAPPRVHTIARPIRTFRPLRQAA